MACAYLVDYFQSVKEAGKIDVASEYYVATLFKQKPKPDTCMDNLLEVFKARDFSAGKCDVESSEKGIAPNEEDGCDSGAFRNEVAPELRQLLNSLYRPNPNEPIKPTGALGFLLPSGAYAQNLAIVDKIFEWQNCNESSWRNPSTIVIATKDAKGCFEQIAPILHENSVTCNATYEVKFSNTNFGRSLNNLLKVALASNPGLSNVKLAPECAVQLTALDLTDSVDGDSEREKLRAHKLASGALRICASDFVTSKYSHFSEREALDFDAILQNDRFVALNEMYQEMLRHFANDDKLHLCLEDFFAKAIEECVPVNLQDQCDMKAIRTASDMLELAKCNGSRFSAYVNLINNLQVKMSPSICTRSTSATSSEKISDLSAFSPESFVDSSVEDGANQASSAAQVRIMSMEQAAGLPAKSVDAIIICDLNTSQYAATEKEGAVFELLEKLGCNDSVNVLSQMREVFANALSVAKSKVCLSAVMNNVDGAKSAFSFLYEDVVNCYRDDLFDNASLGEHTGLTQNLEEFAATLSEEQMHRNLSGRTAALRATYNLADKAHISPEKIELLMLRNLNNPSQLLGFDAKNANPEPHPRYRFSPSGIEAFLSCPYYWLACRRLKNDAFSLDLSPMQLGNFVHSVLEDLYKNIIAKLPEKKITEANLEFVIEKMTEVFRAHYNKECEKPYSAFALKRGAGAITGVEANASPEADANDEAVASTKAGANKDSEMPICATDMIEFNKFRQLENSLKLMLAADSLNMPSFLPENFEWEFGYDVQSAFNYAGVAMRGKVDRLDANEQGDVCVVDYKGKISKEYMVLRSKESRDKKISKFKESYDGELDIEEAVANEFGEGFVIPSKTQAMIYASAVRSILHKNPVGALYLTYRTPSDGIDFAGAISENDVSASDRSRALGKSASLQNMNEYLDDLEEAIKFRLESLINGEFSPCDNDKCVYCKQFNAVKEGGRSCLR